MDPELEPFYGADSPFASDLVRQAPGEPVAFRGVLSQADEEALQGLIVGTTTELRWPTADATLKEGQILAEVQRDPATGEIVATLRTFRVIRDGRRVIDGRESVTYLTEIEA